MEITHIGHSCFKIKTKEATLVIDPYDQKVGYKFPKTEADVLLTTHYHFDHHNIEGVTGYKLLIEEPGEYEISGISIIGLPTFHDNKKGAERGKNTAFLIFADGLCLLHLGDLGHQLEQSTLEKIENVDVLMIPVGGFYTIDAEAAAKVISDIEPGYVLPMHYKTVNLIGIPEIDPLDKFMDEMGLEKNQKKQEKLKVNSKSDIPQETEVIVLEQIH